jgi:hypothetical protein
MSATKSRKWAILSLVLAGGALVFDKAVLSASATETPGPATAAGAIASAQPGAGSTAAAEQPALPRGTLGEFLSEFDAGAALANATDMDEAFGVPAGRRSAEAVVESGAQALPSREGLRLTGILRRAEGDLAIVNGRPLAVGQQVGEAMVLQIGESTVTVQTPIGRETLSIERPSLAR